MLLLIFLLNLDQRYHTLDEIAVELDSLHQLYSEITVFDTLGYSTTDSLPIFAFKISDNAAQREDEPRLLYVACHHAEEILGIEICMYMIQDLLASYGSDSVKTHWIDNREIWFIPLLNPEGHSVVVEGIDTTWRKNKRDNNHNGFFDLDYDGVDPNRNYDFHWDEGGSAYPGSEYYRGSSPFSENETMVMDELCAHEHFAFCATYHSARTGLPEVVYYPWVWGGGYSVDYPFVRDVAINVAGLIIKDDSSGTYSAIAGYGLDGKTRNWLYGVHGTYAFCIEVSTTTIQPGWMVDGICERNLPGAYYLIERTDGPGISGHVYSAIEKHPLAAEVIIHGFHDASLPPRTSDPEYGGFLHTLLPGTYTVEVRMPGYIPVTISDIGVLEGMCNDIGSVLLEKKESDQDVEETGSLEVFPNPSQGYMLIYIKDPYQFLAVHVFDVNGRLCKTFDAPFQSPIVWLCNDNNERQMSTGVYYVIGEKMRYPDLNPEHREYITRKIIVSP